MRFLLSGKFSDKQYEYFKNNDDDDVNKHRHTRSNDTTKFYEIEFMVFWIRETTVGDVADIYTGMKVRINIATH